MLVYTWKSFCKFMNHWEFFGSHLESLHMESGLDAVKVPLLVTLALQILEF